MRIHYLHTTSEISLEGSTTTGETATLICTVSVLNEVSGELEVDWTYNDGEQITPGVSVSITTIKSEKEAVSRLQFSPLAGYAWLNKIMEKPSLPWEQDSLPHPDAEWKVKTEIQKSTIPSAGFGRFVLEDVPKGTIIREVTIVDVSRAKETEADFKPRLGTVLLFHNKEELLGTFEKLAQDRKRSNFYEQIVNFGSVPVCM